MHQKSSRMKHFVPIIQLDSDPELTLPRCVTINVKLVVEILRQITQNCRVISESATMGFMNSIQFIMYEKKALEQFSLWNPSAAMNDEDVEELKLNFRKLAN